MKIHAVHIRILGAESNPAQNYRQSVCLTYTDAKVEPENTARLSRVPSHPPRPPTRCPSGLPDGFHEPEERRPSQIHHQAAAWSLGRESNIRYD